MKSFRRSIVVALALVAACVVSAGSASASSNRVFTPPSGSKAGTPIPADVYAVNYFSNANTAGAPDGTFRITNPGTSGGNLCAQIYVIDQNQEMSECCACLITPNGLQTLSINKDLTSNPLTGVTLATGTIEVVSGVPSGNTCSPLNGYVTPALRSWGTHIQNANFAITETESQAATLTTGNDNLLNECYAISLDGSGAGTCSCGTGE
jgi:hypothetical protein